MAAKSIDLANLFASVTQQLQQNEDALNQADEYNHDHGTNMVGTFRIITEALRARQGATNSEALSYAAQQLQIRGTSGSARLYAQNLQQAASEVRGTSMTPAATLQLLQTLMGGDQERQAEEAERAAAAQGTSTKGLGGLLSSLMGAVQQPAQQNSGLDGLLGGLLGGQQVQQPAAQQSGGLGGIMGIIGTLLGGSQQSTSTGNAGLGALVQTFTGGSGTAQNYRRDSSSIIVSTVLQIIMSMMARK